MLKKKPNAASLRQRDHLSFPPCSMVGSPPPATHESMLIWVAGRGRGPDQTQNMRRSAFSNRGCFRSSIDKLRHERRYREHRKRSAASVSSHLKDPQGTGTMRLCLHGNNRLYLGISWRPEPTGAAGFGPEYPPEACLACADRASVRGSSRDDGDHASSRQEQADGVALAGTLPRGRGRRTVAGSGPGVRQAPLGRRGEIAGVDEDDAGGTAERDPVECSHDGQGRRNQPVCRGSGPSMD